MLALENMCSKQKRQTCETCKSFWRLSGHMFWPPKKIYTLNIPAVSRRVFWVKKAKKFNISGVGSIFDSHRWNVKLFCLGQFEGLWREREEEWDCERAWKKEDIRERRLREREREVERGDRDRPVPSRLRAAAPGNASHMVGLCSGSVWILAKGLIIRFVTDHIWIMYCFCLVQEGGKALGQILQGLRCLALFWSDVGQGGGWGGGVASGCLGASLPPVGSLGVWGVPWAPSPRCWVGLVPIHVLRGYVDQPNWMSFDPFKPSPPLSALVVKPSPPLSALVVMLRWKWTQCWGI